MIVVSFVATLITINSVLKIFAEL